METIAGFIQTNGVQPGDSDPASAKARAEVLLSAFLKPEQLVCVCPDDYSFWEVADKGLSAAAGFHPMIMNMNLVQRLVTSFLRGSPQGEIWGRPAPGVGANAWKPPIPGLRPKG